MVSLLRLGLLPFIEGVLGLCDFARERDIGVLGRWEWVGVSCDGTWDSGKARKTMGGGGLGFGGKWVE
ncbi:hypothetical protein Tco_0315039, partial [Tanacetum coccineum]